MGMVHILILGRSTSSMSLHAAEVLPFRGHSRLIFEYFAFLSSESFLSNIPNSKAPCDVLLSRPNTSPDPLSLFLRLVSFTRVWLTDLLGQSHQIFSRHAYGSIPFDRDRAPFPQNASEISWRVIIDLRGGGSAPAPSAKAMTRGYLCNGRLALSNIGRHQVKPKVQFDPAKESISTNHQPNLSTTQSTINTIHNAP